MQQVIDPSQLKKIADNVYAYMVREHTGKSSDMNEADCHGSDWGTDIHNWDWNPGVGIIAISHYYDHMKRPDVLAYLESWLNRNKSKARKFEHVNVMTPFAIYPEMYERTGDPEYKDVALDYANWIVKHAPRTLTGTFQHGGNLVQEVWADTIFMVVLFLSRLAKLTGSKALADEAATQLLQHFQLLQDPETGVLFHGYQCENKDHMSAARWTRGNAWLTVGTPLILEQIAGLTDVASELNERYRRMIDGLLRYQADNGLWHTVMDEPTYYQETSGSAGIACGIAKAIKQGLLPVSYKSAADKTLQGVLTMIQDDGEVTGVSGGTPIMHTVEEYNQLSCYPTLYGQGLTLMLLSEYYAF
ncbi:glycoside hydrolase family 88/105 protein [Paenibacillus aceris]|uniref:Unsaturated rhamnogalacturonyl hydrolase n=1 Tax=Paenibacillus aceris TaxID=869555 RepID=A0ABS4I391_9BACL|nr:glycoside hydrolase family 88 protein [Paenibacillus aceris]MBP1965365.1 unsaturated rhamnogalacturonyl hydrolase [Paenibacillus aceris]NHW36047.1 glycosyl hydrolase [Paenibacillus aceris]